MGGPGSGQPLRAEDRAGIIAWYQHGVRGHGISATATRFHVSDGAVESTISRHLAGIEDSINRPKTGRPHVLTSQDIEKLLNAIDENPHLTYEQLAAKVDHPVSHDTVRNALKRLNPPVVEVTPVDLLPVELTDDHKQRLRNFVNKEIRHVPFDKRVYADESFIHGNIAPTTAKTRRGQKVLRPRTRWAKKYTLHVYARREEVLHWELTDENASDAEIRRVVIDSVVSELKEGDVLIWDCLGRSGRAKEPKAQHYNPQVKASIEAVGARVQMLPPYGKWLDPVELLFNDLKEHSSSPPDPSPDSL
jgi:transposase